MIALLKSLKTGKKSTIIISNNLSPPPTKTREALNQTSAGGGKWTDWPVNEDHTVFHIFVMP